MARTVAAPVQWFNGQSLDEVHQQLRKYLLKAAKAPTLDDALSDLGYFDTFGRETILRSFRPTLKDGGENYDLTEGRKWLRTRERWADGVVDRGRSTLGFNPTTYATRQVREYITQADGALSPVAQDAGQRIMKNIEAKAGRKLDKTTTAFLAEDVQELLTNDRNLGEQIKIHETYRELIQRQMSVIEKLVGDKEDNRPATT